jgi:DNA-binding MarR family transcriptional regulator
VLAARRKDLEAAGIVERQIAPAPQRGIRYALTSDGRSLEPAVLALARWGNQRLGARAGRTVPASTVALSLRATFNRQIAAQLTAVWEIHAADVVLYASLHEGTLTTGVGTAPETPGLVMTVSTDDDEVPTFRDIMKALRSGEAELVGHPALLQPFLDTFSRPGQEAPSPFVSEGK